MAENFKISNVPYQPQDELARACSDVLEAILRKSYDDENPLPAVPVSCTRAPQAKPSSLSRRSLIPVKRGSCRPLSNMQLSGDSLNRNDYATVFVHVHSLTVEDQANLIPGDDRNSDKESGPYLRASSANFFHINNKNEEVLNITPISLQVNDSYFGEVSKIIIGHYQCGLENPQKTSNIKHISQNNLLADDVKQNLEVPYGLVSITADPTSIGFISPILILVKNNVPNSLTSKEDNKTVAMFVESNQKPPDSVQKKISSRCMQHHRYGVNYPIRQTTSSSKTCVDDNHPNYDPKFVADDRIVYPLTTNIFYGRSDSDDTVEVLNSYSNIRSKITIPGNGSRGIPSTKKSSPLIANRMNTHETTDKQHINDISNCEQHDGAHGKGIRYGKDVPNSAISTLPKFGPQIGENDDKYGHTIRLQASNLNFFCYTTKNKSTTMLEEPLRDIYSSTQKNRFTSTGEVPNPDANLDTKASLKGLESKMLPFVAEVDHCTSIEKLHKPDYNFDNNSEMVFLEASTDNILPFNATKAVKSSHSPLKDRDHDSNDVEFAATTYTIANSSSLDISKKPNGTPSKTNNQELLKKKVPTNISNKDQFPSHMDIYVDCRDTEESKIAPRSTARADFQIINAFSCFCPTFQNEDGEAHVYDVNIDEYDTNDSYYDVVEENPVVPNDQNEILFINRPFNISRRYFSAHPYRHGVEILSRHLQTLPAHVLDDMARHSELVRLVPARAEIVTHVPENVRDMLSYINAQGDNQTVDNLGQYIFHHDDVTVRVEYSPVTKLMAFLLAINTAILFKFTLGDYLVRFFL